MSISYPGFEGHEKLGQEEDKAFQANCEVLKDKVSDAHNPDQIKEVKTVEVGLGKYEARRKKEHHVDHLDMGVYSVFTQDGGMKSNRKVFFLLL